MTTDQVRQAASKMGFDVRGSKGGSDLWVTVPPQYDWTEYGQPLVALGFVQDGHIWRYENREEGAAQLAASRARLAQRTAGEQAIDDARMWR